MIISGGVHSFWLGQWYSWHTWGVLCCMMVHQMISARPHPTGCCTHQCNSRCTSSLHSNCSCPLDGSVNKSYIKQLIVTSVIKMHIFIYQAVLFNWMMIKVMYICVHIVRILCYIHKYCIASFWVPSVLIGCWFDGRLVDRLNGQFMVSCNVRAFLSSRRSWGSDYIRFSRCSIRPSQRASLAGSRMMNSARRRENNIGDQTFIICGISPPKDVN